MGTTQTIREVQLKHFASDFIHNVGVELVGLAEEAEQDDSERQKRVFDQFRADTIADDLLQMLVDFLTTRHPRAAQMTDVHAKSHFGVDDNDGGVP